MRKFFSWLAVGAILGGYALYTFTQQPGSSTPNDRSVPAANTSSGSVGQHRPDYALPDLDGKIHRPGEWDGKVVLVNFWATWCPPCRREIPAFIKLREKYASQGFDIVGIAIEEPESVSLFAKEIGINYTILHGLQDASELGYAFGNKLQGLPFSALVNRQGEIVFTKTGPLEESELEQQIQPLL